MDMIQEYWEILVALFLGVVTAVKLKQETQELRKDVDDINRRDMYTETVKLRAEADVHSKQISELWVHINKLADKIK
tara:strand:+ start:325 stop:555 length:231 start_codon:yes stop_codon:yes gene_type:complete